VTPSSPRLVDPFAGDGEVRALARATDWASTPLGPSDGWSPTLRAIVRASLDSPFPINLWCGPGLTLIYNDAYREVLATKHPWSFGRSGPEVWAEIWPEIAPMFDQIRSGGPAIYADDAPFVVDRPGSPVDPGAPGPNAWFTFSLSPVHDERGEIVAFLNIVSESTRRVLAELAREAARARAERAEARLGEVFSQAPSFLAVLRGSDLVFEYVNDAYYRLVGDRELVGRPVFEALPELEGQGFDTLLHTVLESGEAYVGREVPVLLARSGDEDEPEERFVDFVYYPIADDGSHPSGVVAHGSDVTDHVLARHEAQRARADAEEANRAKSQFLATMSHEIRTPINAIIGYTDLLELGVVGPLTDAQKEHLERVRASSQHLLTLVDDILDLAKVEAGRLEMEYERSPVSGTIASALALVAPQATRRQIMVERKGNEEATFYVGDPDRVRQILVNLLSNAVKFSVPGGKVVVECGSVDVVPDLWRTVEPPITYLRVIDTGIGIDPGDVESIFRPFVQVESGHTRTRGGTGLGLTISRELARMMGGDLTVESEPGEGSTFTLWLPGEGVQESPLESVLLRAGHEERPSNLGTVGAAIQAGIRPLLERYVAQLRKEMKLPGVARLPEATLVDHTSAFVTDVAQSLVVLESDTADPEYLLQDGSEIQRLMAKLHGRQRARLGWTAEALEREWSILRKEIRNAVAADVAPGTDIAGALELLDRFIDRGERISRRTLRHAGTQ
jgi:signal transduction histidine kinase